MSHERFIVNEEVQGPSDRSFGLTFSAVFLIIALFPLFFGGSMRLWGIAVASVLLVVSFAAPGLLSSLNRLWFRFGLLLHKIINPVVLGVLFYLVVTPVGLLMRLSGKDPLRLRFDSATKSYWIRRETAVPPAEGMTNQF